MPDNKTTLGDLLREIYTAPSRKTSSTQMKTCAAIDGFNNVEDWKTHKRKQARRLSVRAARKVQSARRYIAAKIYNEGYDDV